MLWGATDSDHVSFELYQCSAICVSSGGARIMLGVQLTTSVTVHADKAGCIGHATAIGACNMGRLFSPNAVVSF